MARKLDVAVAENGGQTAYHAMPVSAYRVKASGELRPDMPSTTQATALTRKIAADAASILQEYRRRNPGKHGADAARGRARHGAHRVAAGVLQTFDAAEITKPPILHCGRARSVARSSVAGSVATRLARRRLGITSASGHVDLSASPIDSYQVAPTERRQRSGRPSRFRVVASSWDAGKDRAQDDIGVIRLGDAWMATDQLGLRKGDCAGHRDEQPGAAASARPQRDDQREDEERRQP